MKNFIFSVAVSNYTRYCISYEIYEPDVMYKSSYDEDVIILEREYFSVLNKWKEAERFVIPVKHFSILVNLVEKIQKIMVLK